MTIFAAINNAFVTDVNVNCIVEISLTNISILSILDLSANDNSDFIDLKAAENFIYALSFENDTTEAKRSKIEISEDYASGIMQGYIQESEYHLEELIEKKGDWESQENYIQWIIINKLTR